MRGKVDMNAMAKISILVLFLLTVIGFFLFARSVPGGALQNSSIEQTEPKVPDAEQLQEDYSALQTKLAQYEQDLSFAQQENEQLKQVQLQLPQSFGMTFAGEFHTTAYCCEEYKHICGGNGITASGTVPTPGITVAADWTVFPPGTWLYIEDVGIRRVEDSGSAIKNMRLDVAVDTHENALKWDGFGGHNVWLLDIEAQQ